MDVVRITELQPKTYVEQGDYIAIDNQSDGTKKVQFTNLLDDTLSQENKIAPANVVGDEIATIRASVGSPLKASTVAQMTDTNKIYVYVGSESGYTNGNWYYWNGSAWTSGGVYNSVAVVTDPTLTLSGVPADAKATGDEIGDLKNNLSDEIGDLKNNLSDEETARIALDGRVTTTESDIDTLETHKVAQPLDENNQPTDGTNGQLLRTKGDGTTEWVYEGMPTDEQTAQAVSDWLDAHPEATTTVADGSITEAKFTNVLKLKTLKDYITPEMFGAVGDGETDDTQAFQNALDSGSPVLACGDYNITAITVKNTTLTICGQITGQVVISNNATVTGGVITQNTDDACVKFESTLSGSAGYMNGILSDCSLKPTPTGIGICLYSNTNALFGYCIRNIDIKSCNKSIYIYNNKWITKGDFNNIYCHTPNYVIFIDNMRTTNSYVGDLTFRNVFAQYYNNKPLNFFNCNTGACMVTMDNSFCYDGIEEHYYKLSNLTSRITMIGQLKNDIASVKFTNLPDLRCFFLASNAGGDPVYTKVDNKKSIPIDQWGSVQCQAFSSVPAIDKFFGWIGRMGVSFGSSFPNRIFGLSWYDGILTMFRSTDGTIGSGYSYQVTTPYSGAVYTSDTLPTTVKNGATCWCSDIKMAVTYYNNKWYKPDGTELII